MKKIEITIKAYASIAKKYPEFSMRTFVLDQDMIISELLSMLKISKNEIGIIAKNNLRADFESVLNDGDIVHFFPFIGGG